MSKYLIRGLLLLPVLGLGLFLAGIGVFGELPETWWDRQGFLVNLASGLTAACFGIPIAFFGLQRLLEEQTRTTGRARDLRETIVNLKVIRQALWAQHGVALPAATPKDLRRDLRNALEDTYWPTDWYMEAEKLPRQQEALGIKALLRLYPIMSLVRYQFSGDRNAAAADGETRLEKHAAFYCDRLRSHGIQATDGDVLQRFQSYFANILYDDDEDVLRGWRAIAQALQEELTDPGYVWTYEKILDRDIPNRIRLLQEQLESVLEVFDEKHSQYGLLDREIDRLERVRGEQF